MSEKWRNETESLERGGAGGGDLRVSGVLGLPYVKGQKSIQF